MAPDANGKIARVLPALEREIGPPEGNVPGDPVGQIVGTILSQNTTDTNSHRAREQLRQSFPTWSEVRDAPREDIVSAIRSAGLAETKASTIQNVLNALPAPDGEPSLAELDDMDDEAATAHLVAFNGVGVKTAACVLVFALGRDICPVDTHVHRVANRLGIVETKARDRTYAALKSVIPAGKAYTAHVLLVRFGRRVCRARNPLCHACPVFDDCALDDRHEYAALHTERGNA
ncbi:base excision DNA repair protein [Candidatus Poribacteria bacterium]|nr:base excision DNA repair protein [Candidatus Poribacteria bacterium]